MAGLRRGLPRARHAWPFALLVTLTTTALGTATFLRNQTWRDDLTLWLDATRKAPNNPRAWLNAGNAALQRGDVEQARPLLLEAHRLHPCYAYVQMNLSVLAWKTGDLEESLRWTDDAVRCRPGLALAHYYRAAALERLRRLDEALEAYRQTTQLDASHADAWFAQGRLLEVLGEATGAARAYEKALAANPLHADAAMRAGLLYHYRLRDPTTAIAHYRAVLRHIPQHYGAHYQLAMALLQSGRKGEAIRAWRAFVPLAEAAGDRASLKGAPGEFRAALSDP